MYFQWPDCQITSTIQRGLCYVLNCPYTVTRHSTKFVIDFIGFIGLYICLLLGHAVVLYEQVLVKAACTFSSDSNQKQTFLVIAVVSG